MGGDKDAPRRSQRVMLNASVVVVTQGTDNKTVSEETRTVVVNAHGAVIPLRMSVSMGQSITLRNSKTGEEVSCRVAYLSPHQSDKREIGVGGSACRDNHPSGSVLKRARTTWRPYRYRSLLRWLQTGSEVLHGVRDFATRGVPHLSVWENHLSQFG